MVVCRHGDHFFGALLADHIFIELFLDLVRCRYVVDREYGLGSVFLFLLDLGLLAASESASEQIPKIQETDGGSAAVSAALGCPCILLIVLILHYFRILRRFILYDFSGNRSFLFFFLICLVFLFLRRLLLTRFIRSH